MADGERIFFRESDETDSSTEGRGGEGDTGRRRSGVAVESGCRDSAGEGGGRGGAGEGGEGHRLDGGGERSEEGGRDRGAEGVDAQRISEDAEGAGGRLRGSEGGSGEERSGGGGGHADEKDERSGAGGGGRGALGGGMEELWRGGARRDGEKKGDETQEGLSRRIVLPGERLDGGGLRAGPGTYRDGGAVYAATLGIRSVRQGAVSVIPLSGKYIPKPGDLVVGKVIEMTPTAWVIDLNSPYVAPLPASESPWEVEYGETPKYLSIGDTVLLEVRSVDEMKKVGLTMRQPGLRKLTGGQTLDIEATKVPRVIGRGGSMIGLLKRLTRCRIIVGQNGRIWLDGTVDDIHIAMAAIRKIEADSHRLGLTDAVASFIEEMRGSLERRRKEREEEMDLRERRAILEGRGGGGTLEEE